MTKARKRRIWIRRGGLCGACKEPVPMYGPEVRYDHFSPLFFEETDDDENVWPLHTVSCDKPKTSADLKTIGHVRRLAKNEEAHAAVLAGDPRPVKPGPKLRSAPFRRDLRKRMDGRVEKR